MVKSSALLTLGFFIFLTAKKRGEMNKVNLLEKTVASIGPLNQEAINKCENHLDNLTKPSGSLGVLEDLAKKLAGITGQPQPQLGAKTLVVMAGDHGVVAEGVSAFPQEVTPQMIYNFINEGAAINVLCNHQGIKVVLVDVGIAISMVHPQLLAKKVRLGTGNMAKEPAMTRAEAVEAVSVGIQVAAEQVAQGASLLATGDMGIGNTTASSAILAAVSQRNLADLVGKGTGISDEKLMIKERVISQTLELHKPDPTDGLDVLSKVGGLEIGAIAGLILGGAAQRVPVVIDGFIAGAGALLAKTMCPQSVDYMIASHVSAEPGHMIMLELLGLKPMLHMDMRLGEGTGAALAVNLVEAATKIVNQMATFAQAGVTSGN